MRQLTRSWPALAALGASLLFGAVGAGAIGATESPSGPLIGALWIALSLAQGTCGIQQLRSGWLPSPAITLALFLAPVLLWAVLIMLGPLLGLSSVTDHAHASTGGSAPATSLQLPVESSVLPIGPLLVASALSVGVAAYCAALLRQPARAGNARPENIVKISRADAAAAEPPAAGRFVVGLLIGALAVSGLVTPALSVTDAGRLAVPHGEHSSSAE